MKAASLAQASADPRQGSGTAKGLCLVGTQESDTPLRPQKRLPLSPALRARQAQELSRRLAPYVTGAAKITITDNKAVMISIQRDPRHRRYDVRLHHLFVDAPAGILDALGRYITQNDGDASKTLNAYIDENHHRIRQEQAENRPTRTLRTQGRFYDLAAVFEKINRRYFDGEVRCQITWGRHAHRGKSRRSIKVGSFSLEENLIRIHPGLDQKWIPPFYLEWVVFHEMLHAINPAPVVNGRHCFHNEDFARQEKRFAEYAVARTWEQRNIAALLCI